MGSRRGLLAGALAAVCLVGCGSGTTQPAGTSPTAGTARPNQAPASMVAPPAATVPTTPPPATSAPGLTGFGATDAEWNQTHVDDPTVKVRGVAYDPDPSFGGGVSDKYLFVEHGSGRVLRYTLNFHVGTSLASTERAAVAELPPDAVTVWQAAKDGCVQVELRSRTLGRALADPAIGDRAGEVNIEFATGAGYDPTNVTEALFDPGQYPTPSAGPPC